MAERHIMQKSLYALTEERLLPPYSTEKLVELVALQERNKFENCLNEALLSPSAEKTAVFSPCGFVEYVKPHYTVNGDCSFPILERTIEYEIDLGKVVYTCVTEEKVEVAAPLAFGITYFKTTINGVEIKDVLADEIRETIRPLHGIMFKIKCKETKILSIVNMEDMIKRTVVAQ